MFQIKFGKKIKTHTLHSVTFSENRAVYEIKPKNVVKTEKPQTIWRTRVACWISKATRVKAHVRALHPRTHTQALTHARTRTELWNTYFFSTATVVS
jgi:hypothetical protein